MIMRDSFKSKGLRELLVKKIRTEGLITDERILTAINEIPRHLFLESTFEQYAYQDRAFPISRNQTISQPTTVAFQTQLLEVKKNERILEIGTGSGYQAAVLSFLGARVFTIERFKYLKEKAEDLLKQLEFKGIKCFYGDGYKGLPAYAPFSKVIFTAAAPYIPAPIFEQLKIGGMIVVPMGKGKIQTMKRFTKISEQELTEEDFGNFSFVPMLPDTEK